MKKTYRIGLIGHNVGYSKSSDIFNAIFDILSLSGTFELFDVDPKSFDQDFPRLLEEDIDGLSVTIPYKKHVITHLNETATVAHALQAVNSIHIDDNRTIGYNTDCFGFAYPLRSFADALKHKEAFIIGCGGAAKAVCYSLYTDFEIQKFTVLGRSLDKIDKFKNELLRVMTNAEIDFVTEDSYTPDTERRYALLVNGTPAGGWNNPEADPIPESYSLKETAIYYDLNYNQPNRLILNAAREGLHCIDGSLMLVAQAVRSWFLWTGISVPVETVYEVVFGE